MAMISLNLKKKKNNICVLVLKVNIIFTYVYVHVCYVVVYQDGKGAPILFWLVVFSIRTCNLTMK